MVNGLKSDKNSVTKSNEINNYISRWEVSCADSKGQSSDFHLICSLINWKRFEKVNKAHSCYLMKGS